MIVYVINCILLPFLNQPAIFSVTSDLQGIRTNAKRDGDDWILNGSKVFITNGYMCGVVVVVAVTNPEAKSAAHGISLFLVEEGMAGFKKGKKLDKIGMKAQVGVALLLLEKRVPLILQIWPTIHIWMYLHKNWYKVWSYICFA